MSIAERAFASFPKPGAYIERELYDPERAEYEEMLGGKPREFLSVRDFGSVCWGPLPCLTPEAMGYMLPRLMELALTDERDKDGDLFMMRFINSVSSGPSAPQYELLNAEQRAVVACFLEHLATAHGALIKEECWDDVLEQAIRMWRDV